MHKSLSNAQEFTRDVLGIPTLLENDLVDAEATKLDEELADLQVLWNEREASLSISGTAQTALSTSGSTETTLRIYTTVC